MNNLEDPQSVTEEIAPPLNFAKASVAHQEHPDHNEDYATVDPQHGLAVICDGVGSSIGSAQAARVAARTIRRLWPKLQAEQPVSLSSSDPHPILTLANQARQLLEEANQAVLKLARRLSGPLQRMYSAQTTIVLALFNPYAAGYLMTYAHVGDSRAYILRAQARSVERLTNDDGYFLYLMMQNEINAEDALRIDQASSLDELSEQELEHFANRNGITQALGEPSIVIHVGQVEVQPGDRILLCTDGIHDNLTDQEISEVLRQGARTTVARRLIKRATERSEEDIHFQIRAKQDDMTAIVITCQARKES